MKLLIHSKCMRTVVRYTVMDSFYFIKVIYYLICSSIGNMNSSRKFRSKAHFSKLCETQMYFGMGRLNTTIIMHAWIQIMASLSSYIILFKVKQQMKVLGEFCCCCQNRNCICICCLIMCLTRHNEITSYLLEKKVVFFVF